MYSYNMATSTPSSAMKVQPKKGKSPSKPPRTVPLSERKRSDASSSTKYSTPSALNTVTVNSNSSAISDLSGSYQHGGNSNKSPNSKGSIPKHIYPNQSSEGGGIERPVPDSRSWRQAYMLSKVPPAGCETKQGAGGNSGALIVMDRAGESVELVRHEIAVDDETGMSAATAAAQALGLPPSGRMTPSPRGGRGSPSSGPRNKRTPLILILMDPFRKIYELAQLWVDKENDSVRDVLTTVRNGLYPWKQDYDGLIQVRQGKAAQWIHCLTLKKYDVQLYEILIAKPWSMSAKTAASYGSSLLEHLKGLEVIAYSESRTPKKSTGFDTGIPMLSAVARSRVYAPDGLMKHHHAKQYLSFSPAFEFTPFADFDEDDQSSLRSGGVSAIVSPDKSSQHSSTDGGGRDEKSTAPTIMSFSQLRPSNIFGDLEVLQFGNLVVEEPRGIDFNITEQEEEISEEIMIEEEPPTMRLMGMNNNNNNSPRRSSSKMKRDEGGGGGFITPSPFKKKPRQPFRSRSAQPSLGGGGGPSSSSEFSDENTSPNEQQRRRRSFFGGLFARRKKNKNNIIGKGMEAEPEQEPLVGGGKTRSINRFGGVNQNHSGSSATLSITASRSDQTGDGKTMNTKTDEEEMLTVVEDDVPLLRMEMPSLVQL